MNTNPIAKMMKRYIKMPLKKALPLLFIGSLALVATTGCLTSTTTQNSSGSGSGNAGVAVTIISQQTASQVGSGYLVSTPQPGNQFVIFDVTVKNLNQNSLTLGDPSFFKLTTADGTVYEITSLSFLGNNALTVVTNTNPGDKVTGQIAFEIPQSATAKTLTYDDGINRVITTLSPITASAATPTATPSVAQSTITPTAAPTATPSPTPSVSYEVQVSGYVNSNNGTAPGAAEFAATVTNGQGVYQTLNNQIDWFINGQPAGGTWQPSGILLITLNPESIHHHGNLFEPSTSRFNWHRS